jgi:Ca-activated chloride channel homolog
MTNKSNINIQMSWDKVVVPAKTNTERSLLIELSADSDSKIKKKDRPPVNLALVVDRSGSMDGSPIEAAKNAASQIVEKLNQKDCLSLVSFDSEVITHFSNVKMDIEGCNHAKQMISELYARDMTDLSGGWFEGAKCVTEAIDEGVFSNGYVIVLSDGKANHGITDPKELKIHAQELASRGVQTSSIGIGANYSPLQLDALAEGGEGRLHDTETADDIIDVVLGELGEIGNTIARNLKLYIHSPRGVQFECLSKMQGHRSGNFFQIDIGSLQLNQTKSVALLTKVGEFPNGNDLSFKAHVTWEELETGKQNESSVVNSTLKVVTLKKAESAAINSTVVKKVADLWEASLAYRAMIFNEQNRFGRASRIYDDNMESYDLLINSLEDKESRLDRFKLLQRRVARQWQGRSKRASYNLSKKMMMSEPDLRDRDTGNWHDEI